MSYCRFSFADIYIFMSTDGYLECCACILHDGGSQTFDSTQAMVDHIAEHRAAGHDVPDGIEADLWEDDQENWVDYVRCAVDGCEERVRCGTSTPNGYVSCCSIAVLTRDIRSAAVSLRVADQSAQMRCSIALALASSGAALSAPNRKSMLCARSTRLTFGGGLSCCLGGCFDDSLGGSSRFPGSAETDAAQATARTATKGARNRLRMGQS